MIIIFYNWSDQQHPQYNYIHFIIVYERSIKNRVFNFQTYAKYFHSLVLKLEDSERKETQQTLLIPYYYHCYKSSIIFTEVYESPPRQFSI